MDMYNKQKEQFIDGLDREEEHQTPQQIENLGKVDQMLSLKESIIELAVQVQHKIKAFRAMISANLNSLTFPHGLLTNPQEQYESCMSIDPKKLTELLEQDLSTWRENALSRTQLVTNKLETFLEKQTHLV